MILIVLWACGLPFAAIAAGVYLRLTGDDPNMTTVWAVILWPVALVILIGFGLLMLGYIIADRIGRRKANG